MTTLTFYDAAWAPASPPATDGVCIYIGGDTPHIWTGAEIAAQHARYRLPIFVRSNPPGPGAAADVAAAAAQLHAIGAPRGCLVAWDMETAADAGYIRDIYNDLKAAGYVLIVYGSQSTVFGNQVPDGLYFGADWTGVPHIARGDQMTQYVSFSAYDESVALASLPFWDTRPSTGSNWTETIVNELPTVRQGSTGEAVRTVQGLCVARGHQVPVDGSFGPITDQAVRAVQSGAQIIVDGICGRQTWPVLMGV